MIDGQRLLGRMLMGSLRSGGRRRKRGRTGGSMLSSLSRGGMGGMVGMGALGLAFAAYEHLTQKQPPPAGPPKADPPPPPPPPGSPPPPPPPSTPSTQIPDDSLLLVQAMIAAANADGHIDARERKDILEQMEEGDLTDEEKSFLERELDAPQSMGFVVASADTDALRRQVYISSVLAIQVDTPAEDAYLKELAAQLNLSDSFVADVNQRLQQEEES